MVVEHLGLVHAIDGVQLVLALCLGVCTPLLGAPPAFGAPQVERGHQNQAGDDSGTREDQGPLVVVNVVVAAAVLLLPLLANELEHGAVREDVAVLTRVARQALALKVVHLVDAEAVQAGGSRTFVDLLRAVLAGEARRAGADKVVDLVVAGAAVGAWLRPAVVHIVLAVAPDESGVAIALVVADEVEASSAVAAGVEGAVIHVGLAVATGEPGGASAAVGVRAGGLTGPAVLARSGAAVVDLDVAVDSLVIRWALALVASGGTLEAFSAVLARVVGTRLSAALAVAPVEPQGADALVVSQPVALQREETDVIKMH